MELINRYVTRTVLNEWEAQGFASQVSGIRVDAELESFNTTLPRLALRVYRRSVLMAIVYGYQTRANMLADSGQDENVGAVVFADVTNANNDLYYRTSGMWVADTLWGMSNAFKAAITAINSTQTLQTTTPTPGAPGAGVPADGVNGRLLGYAGGVSAWRTAAQAWSDLGEAPNANLPARIQERAQSGITDANMISATGWYYIGSATLNNPLGAAPALLMAVHQLGGYGRHICYERDGQRVFSRTVINGVFSDWERQFSTAAELNPIYDQVAGPTADGGQALGSTSRRFSAAFIQRLRIGGTGQTNADAIITGAAGSDRILGFNTDGFSRWLVRANAVAEAGGNAGSDFQILPYSDAGVIISGAGLRIARATGITEFYAPPKIPSYTVATLPSVSAYTQCLVYVSNGTGNKRLAISDGTNWRFPDGAIVS